MTPSEVLRRAEELLRHGWVQGMLAQTADNQHCEPWDERADKWCEVGAIMGASHYDDNSEALVKYCKALYNSANMFIMSSLDTYRYSNAAIETTNDKYFNSQDDAVAAMHRAYEFSLKHQVEKVGK